MVRYSCGVRPPADACLDQDRRNFAGIHKCVCVSRGLAAATPIGALRMTGGPASPGCPVPGGRDRGAARGNLQQPAWRQGRRADVCGVRRHHRGDCALSITRYLDLGQATLGERQQNAKPAMAAGAESRSPSRFREAARPGSRHQRCEPR